MAKSISKTKVLLFLQYIKTRYLPLSLGMRSMLPFQNPSDSFIYSRVLNPTAQLAESKIAELCHGEKAKLYASGMGAISAAILYYVNHGDHIVTIKNIYAPANNFINQIFS